MKSIEEYVKNLPYNDKVDMYESLTPCSPDHTEIPYAVSRFLRERGFIVNCVNISKLYQELAHDLLRENRIAQGVTQIATLEYKVKPGEGGVGVTASLRLPDDRTLVAYVSGVSLNEALSELFIKLSDEVDK